MDTLPNEIRIGMDVYDNKNVHIGRIDDLKFPENAGDPDVVPADIDGTDRRPDTLLDTVAEAFRGEELPEALRDRLLREGYIRLDADGLFAADRYVLPSQIESAGADRVVLNVDSDALIKRPH